MQGRLLTSFLVLPSCPGRGSRFTLVYVRGNDYSFLRSSSHRPLLSPSRPPVLTLLFLLPTPLRMCVCVCEPQHVNLRVLLFYFTSLNQSLLLGDSGGTSGILIKTWEVRVEVVEPRVLIRELLGNKVHGER